jgi:Txe/YoeB family toxin of Txe-Axe toxin-antitoxin module
MKGSFMSAKRLIIPSSFWAFYEQKKEAFLTKEEEHFSKKVFQYTLRLINGLVCSSNRQSLNQQALLRAAHISIKEYEDFKRVYKSKSTTPNQPQTKPITVIIKPEKINEDKSDAYSDAITEVLKGQVYTADNQFTMMRFRSETSFNEKRRGEHRYPRHRD